MLVFLRACTGELGRCRRSRVLVTRVSEASPAPARFQLIRGGATRNAPSDTVRLRKRS